VTCAPTTDLRTFKTSELLRSGVDDVGTIGAWDLKSSADSRVGLAGVRGLLKGKMPGDPLKTSENCPPVSCPSRTVHSTSFSYQ
jgi:hypothetical protein